MPGMGGMGPEPEPMPAFFYQFQQTLENLGLAMVSARVRTRALIELLEEKGVLTAGQYDEHAAAVWERDYDALADELVGSPSSPPPGEETSPLRTDGGAGEAGGTGETAQGTPAAAYERHYAGALGNFVNEAVASRVRLRAIIELLETRGVFGPGEFDAKAEAIWDRDYEELAMDFYGGKF